MQDIPTKLQGATVNTSFNFLSDLASGETITSQVVEATVYSGVDPTPANVIDGSASVNGPIVNQLVTGGVVGVIYNLLCTINTSADQVLQKAGFLAILAQ